MKTNNFRSVFEIKSGAPALDYRHRLLSAGSCFSAEIGSKMQRTGFDILVNPFGISFHPLAINRMIERALDGRPYNEKDLIQSPVGFACYDFHGSFAASTPESALEKMNQRLISAGEYLRTSHTLMLTWGTAWGYHADGCQGMVNNCHKQPSSVFQKMLSDPNDLIIETARVLSNLRSVNPDICIELTVSPVRHLRDGAVENNRSKAHLLTAVHALCDSVDIVFYFPAFELVMDDLRDYRFFKTDRMHPTEEAVDYVWQRYRDCRMTPETASANEKVEMLTTIFDHKPTDAEAHLQATQAALTKINLILKPWGRALDY